MPDFSAKSYLSNDEFVIHDVPSAEHPDGKTYTITAPSAGDELLMRRFVQLQDQLTPLLAAMRTTSKTAAAKTAAAVAARKAAPIQAEIAGIIAQLTTDDKGKEVDFDRKMLADAYDEMVADGVRPRHLTELASLVMTNYGTSEQVARLVVERAEGEAVARANRADRRASAKSSPRKRPASKPQAGSKSSRASGARNTRAAKAPASTRGRKTSAAIPAAKTA